MTPEAISEELRRIHDESHSASHREGEEYMLYRRVLRAIAEGTASDPEACAKAAIGKPEP